MQHKESVTTPARVEEKVVRITCDICGAEGMPNYLGASWTAGQGSYAVCETSAIKLREGSSYPEGGSGEEYELHICPSCFKDKLIPLFAASGRPIVKTDWDW